MKKIFTISLVALAALACEKLPDTGGVTPQKVALLDNAAVSTIKVKDDSGSDKATEIKVRLANPVNQDTYYQVSLDASVIDSYNKANKVDYELLPSNAIEMSYTGNGTPQTGNTFKVLIRKGEQVSAGKLTFNIKALKDAQGNKLSGANNYAVAVRVQPLDGNIIAQKNRNTAFPLSPF